ncbi:MAG: NifB/NifX family molybdenum-iron cluster-binding protein [Pseudomonadota bacterium]|nr:NifB/NifX family molybdenum-iron cluster-binding protein [Pseudomonadota bacterium]
MRTLHRLILSIGLLAFMPFVQAEEEAGGKPKEPLYAIAADGADTSAEISKLAGISPFFHLYGENGTSVEVVPNSYLDLEFGTGPAAARMLVEKGVVVLVARRIPGPKMMEVLDTNSVRLVRRVGTVQDVASELKE